MGPPGKKPLKGRIFYLDLRFYRNQEELIKTLKKFGGKVESFLCKEVTHVITDRNHGKSKPEAWTPATPKSLVSTPSPVQYDHALGAPDNASLWNDGRTPVLSRGQALVQKAKLKNQGSTDLLSVCSQWNIKVLSLQKVLFSISKYKELAKKNVENKVPKTSSQFKQFRQILHSPFIKIEDTKECFRPQYKVFSGWKDYFSPSFFNVINRMQKKFSKSSDFSLKPVWCGNESSSIRNPLTNLNVASGQNPSPSYHTPLTVNNSSRPNSCSTFRMIDLSKLPNNENVHKDKYNRDSDKKKKKKKLTTQKRYCEICKCYFLSIEEHLLSKNHRDFMNNPTNFKIVEDVKVLLPSLEEFLKKTATVSENPSKSDTKEISFTEHSLPSDWSTPGEEKFAWYFSGNENDYGHIFSDRGANRNTLYTNQFISASCSTDELITRFPYLENALAELPNEVQDDTKGPLRDFDQKNEENIDSGLELPYQVKNIDEGFADEAMMLVNCKTINEHEEVNHQNCVPISALKDLAPPNAAIEDSLEPPDKVFLQASAENCDLFLNKIEPINQKITNNYHEHFSIADARVCETTLCENVSALSEGKPPYVIHTTAFQEKAMFEDVNNIQTIAVSQSTSDIDSVDEKLNINGCIIRKYPFRNFGFGLNVPVYDKLLSPINSESAIDFHIDGASDFEEENEMDILHRNVHDLCESLQCYKDENKACTGIAENSEGEDLALDLSVPKLAAEFVSKEYKEQCV